MKIKEPDFSLNDYYLEIISHYRDKNDYHDMKRIYSNLLDDEKRYKLRLKSKQLYLEEPNNIHNEDGDDKEVIKKRKKRLKNLYTDKMLVLKEIRPFYGKILTSSRVCPYCGARQTTTVDHFLSKNNYPNYSVTPLNLLPCCSDCNKNKSDNDEDISSLSEVFFHPYEESLGDFKWLKASVIVKDKILYFKYYVSKEELDEEIYIRLCNQFSMLKLADYYNESANILFSRTKHYYKDLYNKSRGEDELIKHLKEELKKYSNFEFSTNYFMYVYYETLIKNFAIISKIL